MISFTMDRYWTFNHRNSSFTNHVERCSECDYSTGLYCQKGRINKNLDIGEYNLYNYLVYMLYAPLYLYIPLGGSQYRAINTFVIFTFVAVWHDIGLNLLAWGWLIALFIVPEIVVMRIFCTKEMRKYFGKWHIQLCALGGVLNIIQMISANLVGFAVGVDGIVELWKSLVQWQGKFV
ncbi:glycerol transporter [Terramyces sp. JEL0728]|nr:glycerol transporter [Terramyces sp. JEL0728]